jgi:prefoldin subunit 5
VISDPLPVELARMTVRDALDYFERGRDERVRLFREKAEGCREVERSIYKTLSLLLHMQEQIDEATTAHDALRKRADDLEKEQADFLTELTSTPLARVRGAADERNKRLLLYELAGDLRKDCTEMRAEFEAIRTEPDDGPGAERGAREAEGVIQGIANYHLAAIDWMDSEIAEAHKQLEKVRRQATTLMQGKNERQGGE